MHFRHKNNKNYIKKCKSSFIILFQADLIYSLTTALFFLVTELWYGKFEFILAHICSDLPHHSILYFPFELLCVVYRCNRV